ncbi:MAG: methyltransferase domain-containing protein [Candidatus Limnocylindria bacterium]
MLIVTGRSVAPIAAAGLVQLARRFASTVVDLGTGDGRFVLATAAARPDALVVGVDANAAGMAEASRRAARPPHRGGLANARFIVAPAESLDEELPNFADELHVHFPWGSLLRGLVAPDPDALGRIARLTRHAGSVTLLLSVAEADRAMGLEPLDEAAVALLATAYAAHGLELAEARRATAADLVAAHSSWGKRLDAGGRRRAWLVRLRRR